MLGLDLIMSTSLGTSWANTLVSTYSRQKLTHYMVAELLMADILAMSSLSWISSPPSLVER